MDFGGIIRIGYIYVCLFVCLMLNVPVNKFSVMLGRSKRFLGITSTFGGKYVLLKDSTGRPEWGKKFVKLYE